MVLERMPLTGLPPTRPRDTRPLGEKILDEFLIVYLAEDVEMVNRPRPKLKSLGYFDFTFAYSGASLGWDDEVVRLVVKRIESHIEDLPRRKSRQGRRSQMREPHSAQSQVLQPR